MIKHNQQKQGFPRFFFLSLFGALTLMLFCLVMPVSVLNAEPAKDPGSDEEMMTVLLETARVPVIMYHSIAGCGRNELVNPQAFEADLAYLKEQGYQSVFLADLVDFVYNGKPLPDKPIVLSFDDGYYNNYSEGLPLLEKYDMKIVVSVIGSETEKWNDVNYIDEKNAHLSWAHIREMVSSGRFEIANHTWDLHKNTNGRKGCTIKRGEDKESYSKLFKDDVGKLQQSLWDNCEINPVGFTYPFGSKCTEATDLLKEMGFKVTLACSSGVNILTQDDAACLYDLHRFNRAPAKSVQSILESLEKEKSVMNPVFRFFGY